MRTATSAARSRSARHPPPGRGHHLDLPRPRGVTPALVDALTASGLDPGVARELAPRHAFARACRRLSDRRIIRGTTAIVERRERNEVW